MDSKDKLTNDIHAGDVFNVLPEMPESSVHMCMTSPPYYGLRDYDEDEQIGLEDTLEEYIDRLVRVGDELRRVLRDDGSWWLNLGDTYSGDSVVRSDGNWTTPGDDGYEEKHTAELGSDDRRSPGSLGRKNKMLVPHRVAIALQDAGWVVRNDATWVKPAPMPQSVTDRLNTTTEQLFHLTPEPDYWYDLDAIREPYAEKTRSLAHSDASVGGQKRTQPDAPGNHVTDGLHARPRNEQMHPVGKNPGDVFEIPTESFPEAHFAVYPAELCEKPIKATCPPKVCAECGTGYVRHRETEERPDKRDRNVPRRQYEGNTDDQNNRMSWVGMPKDVVDERWEQTCDCDTDATEPGIALDPFVGAGTTCTVAKRLGRRFVGVDLNCDYVAMAQKRVGVTVDEPERLLDENETTLQSFVDSND